ncbi:MAG: hypothetical protein ACR2NI_11070 [Pirellulales bacterium]
MFLASVGVGLALVLIPEPATTATGLLIIGSAFGLRKLADD